MIPRLVALLLLLPAGPALAQPAATEAPASADTEADAPPAPAAAAPTPAQVTPGPAPAAPAPEPAPPGRPPAAAPTPAQVAPAAGTNPALTDPATAPRAPAAAPPPAPIAADPAAPPVPAAAPPAPARLNGAPPPAPPPPALPWPSAAELRGNGALRLRMSAETPDAALRRALEEIGRRLATTPAGRITVEVQVSGHPRDASLARRSALARAQAVKAALVGGGLPATRIDLRPLGRLDPPADLVDILPPGAGRTQAPR